jgi:hypothetical protein
MNLDFKDLLSAFNAHRVEYLVVGAHALAVHGYVRSTGDLDVWIKPELANAKRVIEALRSFGAPLHDLSEADLTRSGTVFQIGVAPIRIDVLTSIDGVNFDEAWGARLMARFAEEPVPVLSAAHLIVNKKAVGRPQDLVDIDELEKNRR